MQASGFWVLLDQPLTQPSVVDAQKATKALKRLRIPDNQPAGICVRLSAACATYAASHVRWLLVLDPLLMRRVPGRGSRRPGHMC